MHKIQIVCRSMVFGETAMRRSHQTAYWKIERRRAKLPLIVTIWREVHDLVILAGMLQNVADSSVYLSGAATALLVGGLTRITHARYGQSVFDAGRLRFVQAQPGN